MPPKVLVVGAAGYIGEGVAKAFRRAGYFVYGVIGKRHFDNKKEYFFGLEITPIQGDLSDPAGFAEQIQESAIIIDAVYNKEASPVFFEYVKKVRGHAKETYKPLYILTSGIMIYYPGQFEKSLLPKDETFEPHPTDAVEMVPKKKFEDLVLSTKELRTVVVRPGFVYGGHGGVIWPRFFDVDPKAEKLVLTGSPDKRWSWVHVDDLGDAYVKVAQAGSVVDYHIFNLAAQDNPTYEELKIASAHAAGWTGTRDQIVYQEVPGHEDRLKNWETNVIINPRKATDVLGWQPAHIGVLNEIKTYYNSWKALKK